MFGQCQKAGEFRLRRSQLVRGRINRGGDLSGVDARTSDIVHRLILRSLLRLWLGLGLGLSLCVCMCLRLCLRLSLRLSLSLSLRLRLSLRLGGLSLLNLSSLRLSLHVRSGLQLPLQLESCLHLCLCLRLCILGAHPHHRHIRIGLLWRLGSMEPHLRIVRPRKSESSVHSWVHMCVCGVRKHVTEVRMLDMMLLAGLIRHGWDSFKNRLEGIIKHLLGLLTKNPRVKEGATECVAALDRGNIL